LWGGLCLLAATTVLPFVAREGQLFRFGQAEQSLTALRLSAQFPGFWLLIGLAATWLVLGLVPHVRRDRPALWGGLAGCLLVAWLTIAVGVKPYAFGLGSILALGVCVLVLAYGLSQGGYIRADTFVATSILALAFFVLLFVLYPIFAVLQHSVMDSRGFRLGLFLETLTNYTTF